MKVLILNAPTKSRTCMNKDLQGGFGTNTHIGNSILAKAIEKTKRSGVKLPLSSQVALASILNERHSVRVIDSYITGDTLADIVKEAEKMSPDLVFITSSIVGYPEELVLAAQLKGAVDSKIVFYGPIVTVRPDLFASKNGVDLLIKGEIEKVAMGLASDKEIESIKGVSADGRGPVSDAVANLDELPFPSWELFPISKYSYSPLIKAKPFVSVLSSKGCPFACTYCPYVVSMGRAWRKKSSARVLDELEHIISNFGIRGVQFRDPIFALDRQRVQEICKGIIEKGLEFQWGCETRLDSLDIPLLDLMKKAGLRSLNVGVESESEEVLKKATRKVIERSHQNKIIHYCEDNGIRVAAFYILGLPDDTKETINRTINYAKSLNTTVAQFSIATPYPGSEFCEQMTKQGKVDKSVPLHCYDSCTPVLKYPHLTHEELLKLKEKAFVSYYFRPAYFFNYLRQLF